MKPAFSAVELLLVAGISAILVAIAVPGYMEAKTRAEYVDAKVRVNQTYTAICTYKVDYNHFPEQPILGGPYPLLRLVQTQNLNDEPRDRFKEDILGAGIYYTDPYLGYGYLTPDREEYVQIIPNITKNSGLASATNLTSPIQESRYWFVKSIGIDQTDWRDEGGGRGSNKKNFRNIVEYDPTNGLFSLGEIVKYGNLN